MASRDMSKEPDTDVPPAQEHEEEEEEQTDSEDEAHDLDQVVGSSAGASGSSIKKKKSKAAKVLSALKGKSKIPDEVVNQVLNKVKAQGSVPEEDLTVENIREVLEQLKIMDVAKGKAGIGGFNKKDMGEHKVSYGDLF